MLELQALNLLIVANFKKQNPLEHVKIELDDEKRKLLCLVDGAHCCQNVYLYCASEGLKCVESGYMDNEKLLNFLGLDNNTYRCVNTMYVGY